MRVAAPIAALAVIVVAVGCGQREPEPACGVPERSTCEPSAQSWIDPAGQLRQYVVDAIHFPDDASEATELGFNLDGDPLCRVDNSVGQILSAIFGSLADDIDGTMTELVRSGTIIHLVQVRATTLDTAPGAGVTFFVGTDADTDPGNNLDGSGQFVIDGSYASIELGGDIEDGRLRANLGAVPLQLAFSDVVAPVVVTLEGARLEIQVSDGSIEGTLGGSFSEAQFREKVLPVAWALLDSIVDEECTGSVPNCCPYGSDGATIVGLFDSAPEDCQISLEEITGSNLVNSLATPDVDIYDERGRHNPLCDGDKDSLSFGLWFTAVPASF